MGHIKGHDRHQITLFPEVIDDYISDDNFVRVLDVYVDTLDLTALGFKKAASTPVGRPSYDPKDHLKLYLYGFHNRIRSSRRLEKEASRNIEVIWLLRKLKPDFKTIADFRKDNHKPLKRVFQDFTKLCIKWGLIRGKLVAVDGSKFRAVNSRRNNFNKKKLDMNIKYINEKIDKYLADLDKEDATEKCTNKPDAIQMEKQIKELQDRKAKYEGYKQRLEDSGDNEISTTNPDSRLMCNNNKNVDVSYNVQTTVDAEHKLISDFKVTNKPNDLGELSSMGLRAKLILRTNFVLLGDKGYYKARSLKRCVRSGITPYVAKQVFSNGTGDKDFYGDKFQYDKEENTYLCPAGKELTLFVREKLEKKLPVWTIGITRPVVTVNLKNVVQKAKKGRIIVRHVDQDFLDEKDLQTGANFETYKLRQMIVEHPFGTIKRGWGAYYFLTKGKSSVTAEVSLAYLSYNFMRVLNILGAEEMIRRLKARNGQVLA